MAPRHTGQNRTPIPLTQNFQQQTSLTLLRNGNVLAHAKGRRKGKGGHLLTISIYSSSSVMVNTFLGNTANSCKNSCRSEEQKREDATSEHADYPTDSDGLTAASSSSSSYPVYEESENPVKKPNTALPGRLKHPTHSILPQWNLLHDGCFRLLRTRNMQTNLKPRT